MLNKTKISHTCIYVYEKKLLPLGWLGGNRYSWYRKLEEGS